MILSSVILVANGTTKEAVCVNRHFESRVRDPLSRDVGGKRAIAFGRSLFIWLGTAGTLLVGPRVASSLSALGTELQVRCLWNISIACLTHLFWFLRKKASNQTAPLAEADLEADLRVNEIERLIAPFMLKSDDFDGFLSGYRLG